MSTPAPDLVHLLRALPEPSVFARADGSVLVANNAAATLTGRTPSDAAGAPLHALLGCPADRLASYLARAARCRQLLPGALPCRVGGEAFDVRLDAAVLSPRTPDAEAVLFVRFRPRHDRASPFHVLTQKIEALTREILDRRRLEEQRDELLRRERHARLEAERTSRLKDEFLATLSHELRTPLNAILGWIQLLRRAPDPATAAEGIEVIERNADLQRRLIDDLLDMSRIISGKIRLDVQRVDPGRVIEAAVQSIRPAADARAIRLHVTLDPLAGPVKGDPARLQQVVWNLLSNAVKFTPRAGRVQVLLERVNSHIEITVADTGEGIRPEFLPFVFDRFRQADASASRRHGGLGIGLAIVKQLPARHGGSVRAKSPGPGQGATFVVALPIVAVHEDSAPATGTPPEPAAQNPGGTDPCERADLTGIRVLVVDDEPDARELVRRVVAGCHAHVDTADSATGALAHLRRTTPDLIISDIGMPGTDGYELMRHVRALPNPFAARIPAIALSAYTRADDRTRALRAGFNVHLAKPVDVNELVATAASLTGRIKVEPPPKS